MSEGADSSLERFREQVIEQLTTSYSRDVMDENEFEERVEQATAARSHQELRNLILDLPPAGAPYAPVPAGDRDPALSRSLSSHVIPADEATKESSVVAIFSGSDRKGVWDAPKVLNVVAIFGGSDIDLRDARVPAGGLTINAVAMFGGVDVIVPEDLNVVVNGVGIFGGFDGKNRKASDDPRTPTVKIDGAAIFGGVDVKIKPR
jgi:hypothetical protein